MKKRPAPGAGEPKAPARGAVFRVRLRPEEKAAFLALAERARMTASALARRRLLGVKVGFHPPLVALEHLRRACVLAQAMADAGGDGEDIAAILAAQRAAMEALAAPDGPGEARAGSDGR